MGKELAPSALPLQQSAQQFGIPAAARSGVETVERHAVQFLLPQRLPENPEGPVEWAASYHPVHSVHPLPADVRVQALLPRLPRPCPAFLLAHAV